MKQEAAWLEKTCIEGLASDTKYVYKGSGASIYITCLKTTDQRAWIENLEGLLGQKGWQFQKSEAGATIYCLKGEGIRMTLVSRPEAEERLFLIRYPDSICLL